MKCEKNLGSFLVIVSASVKLYRHYFFGVGGGLFLSEITRSAPKLTLLSGGRYFLNSMVFGTNQKQRR